MRRALLSILLLAGCSDGKEELPPIEHELFSHTNAGEKSGLATGHFEVAAVEHGAIAVDPSYRHLLNFAVTPMFPPSRKALPTAGPLILFNDAREVLVFSPLDHFYESLIWFEDGHIHYGVEGEIDVLPAGFTHNFILVKGRGLNRTIAAWGALVRGSKPAPDRYADLGLSHLGYWTDNGAYYYYETEGEMNEEETLLAVQQEAVARGISYGYFQLDSWWYKKVPQAGLNPWGGMIRWEPEPEMFPTGLAAFREKLGLPLILHNRWFAPQNDYLMDYQFVTDGGPEMALPANGEIFDKLLGDAKSWGAFTYEQDWLIPQFWGVPHLRNGVGNADRWMNDIDRAAIKHGLTTQITMAGAAHLMDAVNRPSVTTVRSSIDYAPEAPKTSFWPQFHTANLLAGALGIWPFKDNFHSSETWGEEEALISILSAGMVGGGDRLGAAKPELFARLARKDGMLLKPTRPATPLDAMFFDHHRPYLTASSSKLAFGEWHYLAAYHIERGDEDRRALDDFYAIFAYDGAVLEDMFVIPEKITNWSVELESDLSLDGEYVLFDWQTREAHLVERSFELRPTTEPFRHRYVVLAPIEENGLALLGEPGKYVTVADRRITGLTVENDALRLELSGAPGEAVELLAYDADEEKLLPAVTAIIGADGRGAALLSRVSGL